MITQILDELSLVINYLTNWLFIKGLLTPFSDNWLVFSALPFYWVRLRLGASISGQYLIA